MSATGEMRAAALPARGAKPVALVFAMPPVGHFARLRPLIPGLVDAGLDVVVMTHARFRDVVERSGARLVDLFERYPLEPADAESEPPPVRFVSYAGRYAHEIVADAAALAPAVVVYDSFAVIGRVVGRLLGVPYVNVCHGHDRPPGPTVARYRADPRLAVSDACRRAVATLHELGLEEITPLSWVDAVSPYLNVYGEPPQYLSPESRAALAPLAYYGSVPGGRERSPRSGLPVFSGSGERRRVYVSLGSVGWRLFHDDTRAALLAIVDALAARDDVEALVSLGHAEVDESDLAVLRRDNVDVRAWVDQSAALAEADVFVTHHGLNSVHEAIYERVPMIAYPLFADQPALAELCCSLGFATPLVPGLRQRVAVADVHQALNDVERRRGEMLAAIEVARAWELEVIAGRPAVDRRIAALAGIAEQIAS